MAIALAGGLAGGLVGVGGGILFVPALTIFLGLTQVEAESTSLLMIVIVALVGACRQNGYGNVGLREALVDRRPLAARRADRRRRSPTTSPNAPCSSPSPPWRCSSPAGWSAAPSPRRLAARPRLRSERGFPDLGERRPAAALADADLLLPRLERRRRLRLDARWPRSPSRSTPSWSPQIDPEEFFDFQTTRPTITLEEGQTRRIEWPQNNLLRGPRPDRRPRPGPARRDRAEPALAHLLGDDRDRRRRARRRDGDHAGRADRRGLPHAAGADHRPRLRARSWSRSSTSSAPTTRGRPGSSASSTTAAGRSASTPPRSGRRSRTTSPPSPTRRRRWR